MRLQRRIALLSVSGLAALGLYALNSGGCVTPEPSDNSTATEPTLAAEAVGGAVAGTAAQPTPIANDTRIPVPDKQPQAVHIKATVACEDGGTRDADFNVILGPGSKSIVTDDSIFLSSGWAFLWGHYPWIQTSRASAGAEGSEILVRVQVNSDGTTTESFYHVEGHTWTVTGHHLPCIPETWTDDAEYGLLTPTGDEPTLVALVTGSPEQIFRDQSVATAKAFAGQLGLEAP